MRTRLLTFGISYLLMAAFLSSAEAMKTDPTIDAGSGFGQPAPGFVSGIFLDEHTLALALGETDDSLKWLLALFGADDAGEPTPLVKPAKSADEAIPASGEDGQEFFPSEASLFGSYLAGLAYDDRLVDGAAAASPADDQPTSLSTSIAGGDSTVHSPVAGSPGEKVPGTHIETPAIAFLDPPTTIYIHEKTRSEYKERDPGKAPGAIESKEETSRQKKERKDTVFGSDDKTQARWQKLEPNPAKAPDPTDTKEEIGWQKKERDPGKGNGKAPEKPPAADIPPLITPALDLAVVPANYGPPGSAADRMDFPADNTATSAAPVPEPATMLLLSAGIAGLAFGGRRRNKTAMRRK